MGFIWHRMWHNVYIECGIILLIYSSIEACEKEISSLVAMPFTVLLIHGPVYGIYHLI